jgi:small basic protein (TIGR04137 family)
MSIDPSLKIKGALARHRNVLSRAERLEQLKEEEQWKEGDSLYGLPKVAHRKTHAGKKTDEIPGEAEEAAAEVTEETKEQTS